ncbi:hypothetical protein ECOK1180_1378 [Escherichia coli OK1180]|nr:hypothetical protein ECOK1180_1378 [Escherichia coli OK1180]
MALLLQAGDYMCELINEASKYGKVNERKMDIDLCCKKIEEEGYSVFVAFYDFIKNMAVYMAFIQLTKTPL